MQGTLGHTNQTWERYERENKSLKLRTNFKAKSVLVLSPPPRAKIVVIISCREIDFQSGAARARARARMYGSRKEKALLPYFLSFDRGKVEWRWGQEILFILRL